MYNKVQLYQIEQQQQQLLWLWLLLLPRKVKIN